MVIQRKNMKIEIKEKMRDGDGRAKLTAMVDTTNEKNVRLISEIVLEKGCSIGYHRHDNETEYFLFVSGNGIVNDNGKEVAVGPGDSVVTGSGQSHAVKNAGDEPLVFHAVIVTYS